MTGRESIFCLARAAVILLGVCGGTGCGAEMATADVRVDAYAAGDPSVTRAAPLCFVEPPELSSSDLGTQVRYREIAGYCASVAKQKGLVVVRRSRGGGCFPVTVRWSVSGGTEYEGTDTKCFSVANFYGGATAKCASTPVYGAHYTKRIRVSVFDVMGERAVHQIDAALSSDFSDFRPESAIALCRAAFQSYPTQVRGAVYAAGTEL